MPQDEIRNLWEKIKEQRPNIENINAFISYVTNTWIKPGAIFELSLWNHYLDLDLRTNNYCEGFNSKASKLVSKSHPNFYALVSHLKTLEAEAHIKIVQINFGHAPAKKRKKAYYEKFNEHYELISKRYVRGSDNIDEFFNKTCVNVAHV